MKVRDTSVEWTWVESNVRVVSCLVCCRELYTDELVDVDLGTNYAQDFDLDIDLHSIHMDELLHLQ